MANKNRSSKSKTPIEVCYKIETSKFGIFGVKLISSVLVLLLTAAFIAGGFATTAASRAIYVMLPYVFMLLPIAMLVYDIAQLWNAKDVMSKKLYGSAVVQLRRASVIASVCALVTLLCDFIYIGFVNKEATVKNELMFLLMCALCFIFSVLLFLINRTIKCREVEKVSQPAPSTMPPRDKAAR